MTGVFVRERRGRRGCKDTGDTHGEEGHATMKVETGVTQLQAKDTAGCWGLSEASRKRLQRLQKEPILLTPQFWTSNLPKYKRIYFF